MHGIYVALNGWIGCLEVSIRLSAKSRFKIAKKNAYTSLRSVSTAWIPSVTSQFPEVRNMGVLESAGVNSAM